jgi:hypothetical protein
MQHISCLLLPKVNNMKRTTKTAPAAPATSTHDAAAQAELTAMVAKGKKSKGKKAPASPVVTEAAPAATPSKKQGSTATTKAAATDRGAVKRVIIEAASSAYAALPKTATAKDVLAMRVKVMDELETKGVKRTTASCMLGEWQKSLPAAQQLPARS